jgi:hypothetical protein
MSLNNIQLSMETCQNLFSQNLVAVNDIPEEKEGEKEIKITSLGENQQKILFLIKDTQHKFLADEEMTLLSNLITACKLSMADIALVNFHLNTYNYQVFLDHFQPDKILLFGVTTDELTLPFTIPFFQIQPFQQQLYLTAPSLKILLNNKDLKKELWINLQKLFLKK